MILVTGASGSAGGAVLNELLSRNLPARAMVRSEKDRAALPAGAEVVVGDFADRASLERALDGVASAYLVCSPIPELIELETNFLAAAKAMKLGHVVINSALGAGDFPKSFPSWHRQLEDRARAGTTPWTILRPNGFFQNIATYFAPTIKSQDAFYGTIGSASASLLDVRDVGSAAVGVLTRASETVGKIYELSGPEAFSYPQLAERISKLAGRSIRYVNLSQDQMKQALLSVGMPQWRATAIVELDEYYASGKGAASDAALRGLTNRPPRTVDAYLAELGPTAFAK